MSIFAKVHRWWGRRQYRAYLVDSIHRSTDADQIRRLHDRLRDFDAGGGGKYQRPSAAIQEPPLDCGACPGDGTICTTNCRLMEDSPHPEGCTYPRCVTHGSCKSRCDLAADLYRDGGPAPTDEREKNLHAFLSSKGALDATVTVQEVLDNWKTRSEQQERGRGELAFTNSPEQSARIAAVSAGNAGVQGPCPTCGSDEPFTGTCGASPDDKRALCNQPGVREARKAAYGVQTPDGEQR